MGQLDPAAVAGLGGAVEDEAPALLEDRAAALEMADPELGALQVEQDRRRAMEFLFERADMADQLRFLLLVAVAHVDAKGVGAGQHQPADGLGVARRRAERRQDFHLARAWCEGFRHRPPHSRLRWRFNPKPAEISR